MIVSRDLNATKEPEVRAFTVDVIPLFRRFYNSIVVANPEYEANPHLAPEDNPRYCVLDNSDDRLYYLDIPYPEEFIRSPLRKFVRVLGCMCQMKTYNNPNDQIVQENLFYNKDEGTFVSEALDIVKDVSVDDDFKPCSVIEMTHLSLHSSIAQDSSISNDSFICRINNYNPLMTSSLFEVYTTHRTFRIWFVDDTELKILNLFSIAKKLSSIRLKLELQY